MRARLTAIVPADLREEFESITAHHIVVFELRHGKEQIGGSFVPAESPDPPPPRHPQYAKPMDVAVPPHAGYSQDRLSRRPVRPAGGGGA